MEKIYLLEDDFFLREEIRGFLSEIGYLVDHADSVEEFMRDFNPDHHAVVVVDMALPGGDGIDIIKYIRRSRVRAEYKIDTGIIVITARTALRERVAGLKAGADYYMCKPFDLEELAAILSSLGRRIHVSGADEKWVLDIERCHLKPPGLMPVSLTGASFIVLKTIMAGRGVPVSRRKIVEALGEDYMRYDLRRLDSQIYYLRKLIFRDCGREIPIRSARGRGYQTTEPILIRGEISSADN